MSDNVVRITNQRSQRVYITYIIRTFEGGADADGKETPKQDSVVIRGMGRAIFNAVNIAEIIKRRVVGLHQITTISSETVTESKQEDRDGKDRKVSIISIQLSKKPLDTKNIGYQAPLPADQVTAQEERPRGERRPRAEKAEGAEKGEKSERGPRRGGRRGGRGGRGGAAKDDVEAPVRGGRGAARGGRGARRGGAGDDAAPPTRGGRGAAAGGRGRPASAPARGGRGAPAAAARGTRGGRGGRGGN